MENTGRFDLPLIMPSQAQKHVTHNEALTLLDGLIHLLIKTQGDTAPPISAAVDDAFLVGAPATGAWFGQEGKIAFNTDAGWRFAAPARGIIAFFAAANELRIYEQGMWTKLGDFTGPVSYSTLGVNASADTLNRLAVRSNAALFTALESASGGSGDVQIKLNKESQTDTAAILFQTGFSGRAELGLAGDDALSFKVSADGSAWNTALSVSPASGLVTLSNNSVANAALADMQTARFKGRTSLGTGDPEDLTASEATALLNTFTSVLKGLVPASGGGASAFLRADGTWSVPAGGGGVVISQVTLDFGAAPVWSKTFDTPLAGASAGQKVIATLSAAMPGALSSDELEMDGITVFATVISPNSVRIIAAANPGPVSGQRNFNLTLA
jgi:Protein of unknown function (DUF2793)